MSHINMLYQDKFDLKKIIDDSIDKLDLKDEIKTYISKHTNKIIAKFHLIGDIKIGYDHTFDDLYLHDPPIEEVLRMCHQLCTV